MNVLLLNSTEGGATAQLFVVAGSALCALNGEVLQTAETEALVLSEPDGQILHRASLPVDHNGSSGLDALLGWLSSKNLRVDLVAHCMEVQGQEDQVRRANDAYYDIPSFQAALTVGEWKPGVPQFVYFSCVPSTATQKAEKIAAMAADAPAGCPKKLRVRCERCTV